MSATSAELLRAVLSGMAALGVDSDAVHADDSGSKPAGPATVDVPAEHWRQALTIARDELGCRFFDWLSAVDYLDRGFAVVAHLVKLAGGLDQLLVRTWLPREEPALASVTGVFAGAGWHERETHEMFGIEFVEHPNQATLLLPEEFSGHPLRKDFVLASRVAKAWPGAKEPGESEEAAAKAPSRRRISPPGVPTPEEWGPRLPSSASPPGSSAVEAPAAEPPESAESSEATESDGPRSEDADG